MPHDRSKDVPAEYASPPCLLHEVDPSYSGLTDSSQMSPDQVAEWRKSERERLLEQRQGVTSKLREVWDAAIIDALKKNLGDVKGAVVSAYWPFRGEPDLRPLFAYLETQGARVALPIVVKKGQPLLFRAWRQGERLERGVWNIPYPADGESVRPDILLAPLVGFDRASYRLGYGGGFFDRTLAALDAPAKPVGVGYSQAELPTIHPQSHDIAMKMIVTEAFVIGPP